MGIEAYNKCKGYLKNIFKKIMWKKYKTKCNVGFVLTS